MLAGAVQAGNLGVVVIHLCPKVLEQPDQLQCRRLAQVIHVLLVGHPQQQNPCSVDRLLGRLPHILQVGLRVSVSGVGTQIRMASCWPRAEESV